MLSDALRRTQMHSDALRGTQMHSDALRGTFHLGHTLGHTVVCQALGRAVVGAWELERRPSRPAPITAPGGRQVRLVEALRQRFVNGLPWQRHAVEALLVEDVLCNRVDRLLHLLDREPARAQHGARRLTVGRPRRRRRVGRERRARLEQLPHVLRAQHGAYPSTARAAGVERLDARELELPRSELELPRFELELPTLVRRLACRTVQLRRKGGELRCHHLWGKEGGRRRGEHLHARQLRRDGGDESSAAITSRAFVAVVVVGCVDAGRTTRANVGVEGGDMAKGVDAAEALVRANVLRSREGRLLIDESLIDESIARCTGRRVPHHPQRRVVAAAWGIRRRSTVLGHVERLQRDHR